MLRYCLAFLILFSVCEAELQDTKVVKARIESCGGWRLNRLPEVKRFIYEDVDQYPDTVTFKKIPGAPPSLKFLNAADEVVEEIDLSLYTKDGCNMLLEKHGFAKKPVPTEETNEEL